MTGPAIVVGGLQIEQGWLLLAALLLVGMGAVMVRVGFRRGKGATER
ncbi:hypothetical protein ACIPPM_26880 [Streptomyces sp. NPDC090119]